MSFHAEGVKGKSDDETCRYGDEPGAIGTMRVVVRMTWTLKHPSQVCQCPSTT